MDLGYPVAPIAPEPLDKQWRRLTKHRLREIARLEWAHAEKYYNAYKLEYANHYYYKAKFEEVTVKLAELEMELEDVRETEGRPGRVGEEADGTRCHKGCKPNDRETRGRDSCVEA